MAVRAAGPGDKTVTVEESGATAVRATVTRAASSGPVTSDSEVVNVHPYFQKAKVEEGPENDDVLTRRGAEIE